MNVQTLIVLVFSVVLLLALIVDLGLLSKKNTTVTIKSALFQTIFWVLLALSFGVFIWYEDGAQLGLEYFSAYLMEWSLSIDNIFVFILIFSSFKISEKYYGRTLLIGILMAIILRIAFITVGVAIVNKAYWIMYFFGAFLIFTGYKMFTSKDEEEFEPKDNKVFKLIKQYLPVTLDDIDGKFWVKQNGKILYTVLSVVIIMLAFTDVVFALDSIPAVMVISKDPLVIYTSNIFAILGLRSLFFLLRGAVNKFEYLQKGIAFVLIFIGIKMFVEHFVEDLIPKNVMVLISLLVIILSITTSIFFSMYKNKKEAV